MEVDEERNRDENKVDDYRDVGDGAARTREGNEPEPNEVKSDNVDEMLL